MSTDELEKILASEIEPLSKKEESSAKRVEKALQRALDDTTPERAGSPWGAKQRRRYDRGGIRIPEDTE